MINFIFVFIICFSIFLFNLLLFTNLNFENNSTYLISLFNKIDGDILLCKEFIMIGKVISTHGNRGEVKISILTDLADRFKNLNTVFLRNKDIRSILNIEKIRIKENTIILKFKDINNIEEAKTIIGSFVEVERKNAVKLPKDTFFIFEIIGLKVYTENNIFLGEVENVISTGSNDVYVIKGKNKRELCIPAIHEVVKNINLEKKRIIIKMVDGLL